MKLHNEEMEGLNAGAKRNTMGGKGCWESLTITLKR